MKKKKIKETHLKFHFELSQKMKPNLEDIKNYYYKWKNKKKRKSKKLTWRYIATQMESLDCLILNLSER